MRDTRILDTATPPGSVTGCTPQQEQAARLAVCSRNTAADARGILEHLGLIPPLDRPR